MPDWKEITTSAAAGKNASNSGGGKSTPTKWNTLTQNALKKAQSKASYWDDKDTVMPAPHATQKASISAIPSISNNASINSLDSDSSNILQTIPTIGDTNSSSKSEAEQARIAALQKAYDDARREIDSFQQGGSFTTLMSKSYKDAAARLKEAQDALEKATGEQARSSQDIAATKAAKGIELQTASSIVSAGTTLANVYAQGQTQGMTAEELALAKQSGGIGAYQQQKQDSLHKGNDWVNDAQARADKMFMAGMADIEAAKSNVDATGAWMIDASSALTGIAIDTIASTIVPGSGLVNMAIRVFGQAAAESRLNGEDINHQVVKGIKSAAIEVATEKIMNIGLFKKPYGGAGEARQGIEALVDAGIEKFFKTEVGKALAKTLAGGLGEGTEEVMSDVLNDVFDYALARLEGTEANANFVTPEFWEQALYDGLTGAALGLVGATGNFANINYVKRAAKEGVDATINESSQDAPQSTQAGGQQQTQPTTENDSTAQSQLLKTKLEQMSDEELREEYQYAVSIGDGEFADAIEDEFNRRAGANDSSVVEQTQPAAEKSEPLQSEKSNPEWKLMTDVELLSAAVSETDPDVKAQLIAESERRVNERFGTKYDGMPDFENMTRQELLYAAANLKDENHREIALQLAQERGPGDLTSEIKNIQANQNKEKPAAKTTKKKSAPAKATEESTETPTTERKDETPSDEIGTKGKYLLMDNNQLLIEAVTAASEEDRNAAMDVWNDRQQRGSDGADYKSMTDKELAAAIPFATEAQRDEILNELMSRNESKTYTEEENREAKTEADGESRDVKSEIEGMFDYESSENIDKRLSNARKYDTTEAVKSPEQVEAERKKKFEDEVARIKAENKQKLDSEVDKIIEDLAGNAASEQSVIDEAKKALSAGGVSGIRAANDILSAYGKSEAIKNANGESRKADILAKLQKAIEKKDLKAVQELSDMLSGKTASDEDIRNTVSSIETENRAKFESEVDNIVNELVNSNAAEESAIAQAREALNDGNMELANDILSAYGIKNSELEATDQRKKASLLAQFQKAVEAGDIVEAQRLLSRLNPRTVSDEEVNKIAEELKEELGEQQNEQTE